MLDKSFFKCSGGFEDPTIFISKRKPRPEEDRYAPLEIPSDPIYAVCAEKRGGTDFSLTKAESGITICLYSAVFY